MVRQVLPQLAANHGDRIIRRLVRDIFPWLGGKPVAEISTPQLPEVIRRIEQRGALETAHGALGNCGQIFRYAVATGRAERDPTDDLNGAPPPVKGTHFSAVTDPKKVGGVLRAIDSYEGTLIVRCALRLTPLVFVRPIVPLSRQAVEILQEIAAHRQGGDMSSPAREILRAIAR